MTMYMKALLQVSVFVVEKKSKWLCPFCCSASSSDTLPSCYTFDILEMHRDSLSRGKKRPNHSGLLVDCCLKLKQDPWYYFRLFYVIMRKRCSLDLHEFHMLSFLYIFMSFLLFSVSENVWCYLTRLQPPHWCTNSIPCWQKGEHFTQKQMGMRRSAVHCF